VVLTGDGALLVKLSPAGERLRYKNWGHTEGGTSPDFRVEKDGC